MRERECVKDEVPKQRELFEYKHEKRKREGRERERVKVFEKIIRVHERANVCVYYV